MKKITIVGCLQLIAVLAFALPIASHADPIAINLEQGGFSDGDGNELTIVGMATGEDDTGDGYLDQFEVRTFMLSLLDSDNNPLLQFQWDDLLLFFYDIGNMEVLFMDVQKLFDTGDYYVFDPAGSFVEIFGQDGSSLLFAVSQSAIEVTPKSVSVPEPGTLALLGVGLFGLGLARRRRIT